MARNLRAWWHRWINRFNPALRQQPRRVWRQRPLLEMLEERQLLSGIYTVTSTADDGSAGTLRAAINAVNAGTDTEIDFNISGSGLQGIYLTSALPKITAANVYINGASEGTFQGVSNTSPLIELNGASAGTSSDGLLVDGASCTVTGLYLYGFSKYGIELASNNNVIGGTASSARNVVAGAGKWGVEIAGSGNQLLGNFIGTDNTGETAAANLLGGVDVEGVKNTIGGTTAGAGNVVSGNGANSQGDDILIGSTVSGTLVQGNAIGTDATGNAGFGNGYYGVAVTGSNNTIGGSVAGAGNQISGEIGPGVFIASGVSGVLVAGNYVGLTRAGNSALANSIGVLDQGNSNTIGGSVAAARNVISGNTLYGLDINGGSGTLVEGNYVGTSSSGSNAVANGLGIHVLTSNNTIGVAGAGNVVSGNSGVGININLNVTGILLQGNFVGLTAAGTGALANSIGIQVGGASNTVGGTATGAGNVISGNTEYGLYIDSTSATGVVVQGNYVGTDSTGTIAIGNSIGVEAMGNNDTIGGSVAGAGNVISGNNLTGLFLGVTGITVQGNYIGTNAAGSGAVANGTYGIDVEASKATIGGATVGSGNVISGNGGDGVFIDTLVLNTVVLGNSIGTDVTGKNSLGNANGIEIAGAANTLGGTTAASRNIISSNGGYGVEIDSSSSSNLVLGNYVGSNIAGSIGLANGIGIEIAGIRNTIGGTTAGSLNLISGNSGDGVQIASGSTGNLLQGNHVGTDSTGSRYLSNGQDGIEVAGNNNTIGGTAAGVRNVISGNGGDGIRIDGSASGIVVQGDYLGLNALGSSAISNNVGIEVDSSTNTIGGTASGARNVISGNTAHGILVDSGVGGIVVQGNFIGTNSGASGALGNYNGVTDNGNNDTIGGTVSAARNVISGNSNDGVYLGGTGGLVEGNYVGLNNAGSGSVANGNAGIGVAGNNNTIGGTTFAQRNIISGNTQFGVYVTSTGVLIEGNYVGTNNAGSAAVGNAGNGVDVDGDNNTVGGTASGSRNVISGNGVDGLHIGNNSGVLVQGNYVGTTYTGNGALGNGGFGVDDEGPQSTIGGTATAARNIISGNVGTGLGIRPSGVTVQGNYIGTNVAGAAALGNGGNGVFIQTGGGTFGGTTVAARNIVSGNTSDGVLITGTNEQVEGNFIGTDVHGTGILANGNGVELTGNDNTVGGITTQARNIISGNTHDGVLIDGGSTGNQVQGNYVGTNVGGTAAMANSVGVEVQSFSNTIGGTVSGARNVISGNTGDGVSLTSGTFNAVQGNLIGTNYIGTTALANGANGVEDAGGLDTIGGTTYAARNIISGNGNDGVLLDLTGNTGVVEGNFIGVNVSSAAALKNNGNGVEIAGTGYLIGGTASGARNVVSGNGNDGVFMDGTATDNAIQGDFIGVDSSATKNMANSGNGVEDAGANNTVGGNNTADRNVISANAKDGIVYDSTASSGLVQGNYVGTDITGKVALSNANGIEDGGTNDTIGGTVAAAHNVISGNTGDGILYDSTASGGLMVNNFVGLTSAGTAALANSVGVVLQGSGNVVGGSISAARNVISGNTTDGVLLSGSGNVIKGNYIGTNSGANGAVANSVGIEISGVANSVGGTTAGTTNIISGNTTDGILIDSSASGNQVMGNYLGLNYTGAAALANSTNGIEIKGNSNTVGGIVTGSRNIISGNTKDGVLIDSGASGNAVQGNYVGVNLASSAAVANGTNGIEDGSTGNTIGGAASAARNVIAGNTNDGVLYDSTASGEVVLGNFIGVGSNGKTALGNKGNGVEDQGTSDTIGGTAAGARNVISGNTKDGVLYGSTASSGALQGNYVGLDITGSVAVANANGVELAGSGNTIGGTVSAARNIMSGNTGNGVLIDSTASGNAVQGNYIGTDHSGAAALSNGNYGVNIAGSNNTVGGTVGAASNAIAFNSKGGVDISAGSGNTVRWNSIFSNGATKTGPGITEAAGANNNIVAPTLTSAVVAGTSLTVKGTFTATAGVTYVLEFYANPTGDAEGKIFLGKMTMTPSSSGTISFTFTTTTSVTGTDPIITSTVTDGSGNTSAFSAGMSV